MRSLESAVCLAPDSCCLMAVEAYPQGHKAKRVLCCVGRSSRLTIWSWEAGQVSLPLLVVLTEWPQWGYTLSGTQSVPLVGSASHQSAARSLMLTVWPQWGYTLSGTQSVPLVCSASHQSAAFSLVLTEWP